MGIYIHASVAMRANTRPKDKSAAAADLQVSNKQEAALPRLTTNEADPRRQLPSLAQTAGDCCHNESTSAALCWCPCEMQLMQDFALLTAVNM